MRKLLLFLMLLIAAAPPLLADYTFTIFIDGKQVRQYNNIDPNGGEDGWGTSNYDTDQKPVELNVNQEYVLSFSLTKEDGTDIPVTVGMGVGTGDPVKDILEISQVEGSTSAWNIKFTAVTEEPVAMDYDITDASGGPACAWGSFNIKVKNADDVSIDNPEINFSDSDLSGNTFMQTIKATVSADEGTDTRYAFGQVLKEAAEGDEGAFSRKEDGETKWYTFSDDAVEYTAPIVIDAEKIKELGIESQLFIEAVSVKEGQASETMSDTANRFAPTGFTNYDGEALEGSAFNTDLIYNYQVRLKVTHTLENVPSQVTKLCYEIGEETGDVEPSATISLNRDIYGNLSVWYETADGAKSEAINFEIKREIKLDQPRFGLFRDGQFTTQFTHMVTENGVEKEVQKEIFAGDDLYILIDPEFDTTVTFTVQKEGEEPTAVPLTFEFNDNGQKEAKYQFNAGTYTYAIKTVYTEDPSIEASNEITLTIDPLPAPVIALTVNEEAVEADATSINAYTGDTLTIASEQVQNLPRTLTYKFGEEEEVTAAYTEPVSIALPVEAGEYELVISTEIDNFGSEATRTVTVNVKDIPAPQTPTFRHNNSVITGTQTVIEGEEVTLTTFYDDYSVNLEYAIEYSENYAEGSEETTWATYESPIVITGVGTKKLWARAYTVYNYAEGVKTSYSNVSEITFNVLEDLSQEEEAMTISFSITDKVAPEPAEGEEPAERTDHNAVNAAELLADLVTTPEALVSEVSASKFYTSTDSGIDGVYVDSNNELFISGNDWVTFKLDEAKVSTASAVVVTFDNVSNTTDFEMSQYAYNDSEYESNKQTFNSSEGTVRMNVTDPLDYITIYNNTTGALKVRSISIVAEVERAETPTISVNEENGTVTITPRRNTAQVYWGLMNPNGNVEYPASVEYTALVEDGASVAPSYTVTPDGPGYIFVYAESENYANVGALASDYVHDTFRYNLKDAYVKIGNGRNASNKVSNEEKVYVGIYSGEGEAAREIYTSFGDNFKLVVTNAENADVTIEGNESQNGFSFNNVTFTETGVLSVVAEWTDSEWFLDGETTPVEVSVYAVLKNDNMEMMSGENSDGWYYVPFIQITEGDTEIEFSVPTGVKVWYAPMNVGNGSEIIRRADEAVTFDPVASGFAEAVDNKMPISGTEGSFLAVTESNGVYSPAQQYYYGTDSDVLKDITTGVIAVGVDAEGVEYYDLNGLRVNGNELKAGIYVRVANGKATKVVVK